MILSNDMTRHSHAFIRYPQGRYKALTFSFDDGSVEDMWLAELLSSHGMKGTFNLNTGFLPDREDFDFEALPEDIFCIKSICHRMTERQIRSTFADSEMELSTHGYSHAMLPLLEDDALIYEVMRDRILLEDIMGVTVRGHAYAQGVYDGRTKELLEKAGIVYARTCNFTHGFGLPRDFMEWDPSCHYTEEGLVDSFLELKPDSCIWSDGVDAKLFCIFAHSYELSNNNTFGLMERIVERLAGKEDIWYCTNMEYYRYTMAFRRLDFDLARTRVYNPSAIPVWIFVNGKTVEIGAGETVAI